MTAEEQAIADLALTLGGEIDCAGCAAERKQGGDAPRRLVPRLDRLDQSGGPGLDAVTYECVCGWRKTVPRRLR